MIKSITTAVFLDKGIALEDVVSYIKCDEYTLCIKYFNDLTFFNANLTNRICQLYLYFSSNQNEIFDFLKIAGNDKTIISIIINKNSVNNSTQFIKAGAYDVIDVMSIHTLPFVIFRELNRYSESPTTNNLKSSISYDNKTNISSNPDKINILTNQNDEFSLLKIVFDSFDNHLVSIKDANTRTYIYANTLYCKVIKKDSKDVIGYKAEDIFPLDLANSIIREEDILIQNHKDFYLVEDYKNPESANQFVLSNKKSIIFDKDKKPLYILGIIEDISNEIEIQAELKKSSQRFSKIFHFAPIAITVNKVIDNSFVDFNQSFLDLVGFDYEELIGKNLLDTDIWVNEKSRLNFYNELTNRTTFRNLEIDVKGKSNISKTMLLSVEYIQYEDELLYITMGLDITEIKNGANMLQNSLYRQQELNMLKNQFISMISHEFRTPLTTIMLSTDMLKRYGDKLTEDDKLKHYNRIQETILRMTQLMENVLILGKMDAGKFDLHNDRVDLKSYCSSIASNIEFNTGGLYKINYNYHSNEKITIIDENIFGLIITNLLTNAVKYSPKLSSVEFDVQLNETTIVLKVRDYGIGIPEDDLKNLFNEFFRASNVGSTGGYGLGLSIVKKCFDSCDGQVNIESKVSFGTTFIVTIPRIFNI